VAESKMPYVYILKSEKTERYYVGSCEDLDERFKRHNNGRNKATKLGMPWKLIYSESFLTKHEAYRREFQIKSFKSGEAFKKLITSK